jgi:uncharacterized protein (DUF1501 family)
MHLPAKLFARRDFLRAAALGVGGVSMSGWLPALASQAADQHTAGKRTAARSCILLWMTGGPSQTDTLDPKPGYANAGPLKAIATSVPGIDVSEHLPQLARRMDDIALIRSMSTKEGDHGRATYLLKTGYPPQGAVQYPTLGSLVSRELGQADAELPNYVSIGPLKVFSPGAFSSGFLGPQYSPLAVGGASIVQAILPAAENLQVKNLALPAGQTTAGHDARLALLNDLEHDFANEHFGPIPAGHQAAYRQAVRLMRSSARRAFELEREPVRLRDAYGRNQFGQGCLLARRLVEVGVPFVEVSLNGAGGQTLGWDTHANNFGTVKRLCQILDPAWATLLADLKVRGLLDTTLVVWMGEFGRTPTINATKGRDHFPTAWSTALCGGGIRGGQVLGKTSADGMEVEERPVSVPDLIATICTALGLDPMKQNPSNVGRPIRLADPKGKPLGELLA